MPRSARAGGKPQSPRATADPLSKVECPLFLPRYGSQGCTEYSFFLALPTLIIATGYKLIKAGSLLNAADFMALFLGM